MATKVKKAKKRVRPTPPARVLRALEKAARLAGNKSALTRMVGKLPGHYFCWSHSKKGPPPEIAKKIEAALLGKVKRWELRPDVFDAQ